MKTTKTMTEAAEMFRAYKMLPLEMVVAMMKAEGFTCGQIARAARRRR